MIAPRLLRLLVTGTVALVLGCAGEVREAAPVASSPVFIISIDTLRADRLPAYGYRAGSTPTMDRFREDAILFERAYSNVPMTLPSHASIFSGQMPYRHGVRDNIGYSVRDDLETLASILARNGYSTGGAVSSYVLRGETGISRGFGFYDDVMTTAPVDTISSWQRPGGETATRLAEWVRSVHGKPVFGFLHIYEPHYPWDPPEPYASQLEDAYDGEVAAADAIVGEFLEQLRASGLYEQSMIVILSDHGEGLGDHGELEHGVFLYREAIHVPLMIKLPGQLRRGETVETPASLTDVVPTVLARLGIDAGTATDGLDLLAADLPADRVVYGETYYPRLHYGWSELFSQIDGTRHLIDAPSVELYDHVGDPRETLNLASKERRTVAAMRESVRELIARFPFTEPAAADPEVLAKLESLGYLGGGSGAEGPRADPKEKIGLLTEFGRGAGALQRGDFDRAISIGRSIVAENPDFLQGWGLISSASRAKGDLPGALRALEAQMERAPGNPQTALALASITYEMRRYDEARTYAEIALGDAPALANELIARIELARANLSGADEAARVASEASPRRVEPWMLRSLVAHERGEIARELEYLDRARTLIAGTSRPIAELEFRRGQALLQLGRPHDAKEAFRAETEAFPDHRMAWINLALVTGALGDPVEAEAILDRAIARHSGSEMERLVREARSIIRGAR